MQSRPIDEITIKWATEFYNNLAVNSDNLSPKELRDYISRTFVDFLPITLPDYITRASPELFNRDDIFIKNNSFFVPIGDTRREMSVSAVRRAWCADDLAHLVEIPSPDNRPSRPFGNSTKGVELLKRTSAPRKTTGLCLIELTLDFHVANSEDFNIYTFCIDSIPEISALSIRVPKLLGLHRNIVGRTAQFSIEMISTFVNWIIESISDEIRKHSVKLSISLYRRPRVILPDIAPYLVFACLSKGRDYVLFDDSSFTGFVDAIQKTDRPTNISSLRLASVLLGEIVDKNDSAISFVLDKKNGEHITVKMDQTTAYKNDEVLRHALIAAWGEAFICLKVTTHSDVTFVLFGPAEHERRILKYFRDNSTEITAELKGCFDLINSYTRVIADMRLSSLFDKPSTALVSQPLVQPLSLRYPLAMARRIFSDKATRDEAVQTAGALFRKFFFGT